MESTGNPAESMECVSVVFKPLQMIVYAEIV